MARLLCLVACFFISFGLDACVSGSKGFVGPSPMVIPSCTPEGCTSGSVSVHFNTSTLTIVEGSIIDIQLVAQGRFCENFTVNLTFKDGTAKYLSDYLYPPLITPSVTFAPGSISSSVFRVFSIPNNIWEGAKSFEVGFVLPSCPNLDSGRPDTLRVNIADDDSVHISFQRSTQTVREDSGSVQLQLQSSGLYGRRFSVSFRCIELFPVEAKDGEDFTGGVYTVEFQTLGANNSVSSTAEIPILNDLISEPTQSFICVILRPRGMEGIVVEHPNTITIIIEEDDVLEVSFETAVYFGEEGSYSPGIRLKATEFEIPFSVQIFATVLDASRPEKDCEATSGVDYTDPRSLVGGGVVEFYRAIFGLVSTSVTIPILSDNIAEGTECFGLSFVAITNGDDLGIMAVEPTMAIVCINDTNDLLVRFASSNFEIVEDASSLDVYFQVVREVSPGVYLPAEYTFDFQLQVTTITVLGSATVDVDFEETVGSVAFSAGEEYSIPFSVNITDDTLCECPEQFTVSYSIISSSVRSGANVRQLDSTATVVIVDNDDCNIAFEESSQTVAESAGVVELRLVADNVFEEEQSIDLSAEDGTANNGSDYVVLDRSVRFPPNSTTSGPIRVQIVDNMRVEPTETFNVMLMIPEPATICRARGGAIIYHTISIEDDDKIFIRFEQESYEVSEGGENLNIRLELVNGTILRPFDVSIVFMEGTALENEDFLYDMSTIASFGEGATESSVVIVQIIEDTFLEGNEDFTFRGVLDIDTATRVEILHPSPRVTIIDNDLLTVELTEDTVTVTEGTDDVVKVTVQADIMSDFPFHVFINLMDGTAKGGTDFVGDRIRVDFAPFQTSVDVSIPLIDDNTAEEREWFTAELEVPPEFTNKSFTAGGIVRTQVTINDDDCVTVTMTTDKVTVTEGSDLLLNIGVMGDFEEDFKVALVLVDGSASNSEDFIGPSDLRVRFTPNGDTSYERVIAIVDDKVYEGDETFSVVVQRRTENTQCYKIVNGTLNMTIGDDDLAVVSFVESNVTGGEGDVVKLRVKRMGSITRNLKCKVRIESITAEKGVDFRVMTKSVEFKKLNADSEVKTVRVKLLSGNANCFRVVLECKPRVLIGSSKPSSTVCIQRN